MSEPRELPILMSGPLVRATIAGRKTETRRPVKGDVEVLDGWPMVMDHAGQWVPMRCPYGEPGDLLYLREAWGMSYVDIARGRPHIIGGTWGSPARPDRAPCVVYRADDDRMPDDSPSETACWRPSIHMPRWAARIWLRVAEVRVERVQEITEEGAWAEGVDAAPVCCGDYVLGRDGVDCCGCPAPSYPPAFEAVWDDIYGRRRGLAWADNPWVWVVQYEVISTTGRPA